jgi:hypothetical protein
MSQRGMKWVFQLDCDSTRYYLTISLKGWPDCKVGSLAALAQTTLGRAHLACTHIGHSPLMSPICYTTLFLFSTTARS